MSESIGGSGRSPDRDDPYATPPPTPSPGDAVAGGYGRPPGGYGTGPTGTPPVAPVEYGAPYGSGYGAPPERGARRVPGSVRTVAILLYIGAAFAFVGALLGLVVASANGYIVILALVLAVLGAAYIFLAVRLQHADRTARMITVVLSGLSIVLNLVQLGRSPLSSLISITLGAVIIYLLMFHPDSKRFFGDPV